MHACTKTIQHTYLHRPRLVPRRRQANATASPSSISAFTLLSEHWAQRTSWCQKRTVCEEDHTLGTPLCAREGGVSSPRSSRSGADCDSCHRGENVEHELLVQLSLKSAAHLAAVGSAASLRQRSQPSFSIAATKATRFWPLARTTANSNITQDGQFSSTPASHTSHWRAYPQRVFRRRTGLPRRRNTAQRFAANLRRRC